VELSERDSKKVIAATKRWMKNFDPSDTQEAHHLLEALWLHQQHNIRDEELLKQLLSSPIKHAAIAAKRGEHLWGRADPAKNVVTSPIKETKEKLVLTIPKHFSAKEAKKYKLGAEVYHRDAHCYTCHQKNGEGLPNIYPPLSGSPWVTGSQERLIKLTLHGLWGKITVNGKTFDSAKGVPPMTTFKSLLSDNDIAAVLTYVRNSWGNKASQINPKAVKRVREASKGQKTFYKPEELLKEHPLP